MNQDPRRLVCVATFAMLLPSFHASELIAEPPNKAAESSLACALTPVIKRHRGDVAVLIKHLPSGATFSYRDDEPMPTASLIKLPVMMATYDAAEAGLVDLDDLITLGERDQVQGSGVLTPHFSPGLQLSLRDALRLMIAFSDNTATNLVIDRIGLNTTNDCMKRLGCDESRLNAKVYDDSAPTESERRKKFGLGSTTAAEMVRLLELLHAKQFVNVDACEQMLTHLRACDDDTKVCRLLPDGVVVANKTGAVNAARTDAGIIESPAGAIVYCVLTCNNEDRSWSDDNEALLLAGEIGMAAYQQFNSDLPPNPPTVARILQMGDKGDLVESLQRTLNAAVAPSPDIGVDGDFGPNTQAAVIQFQQQSKLEPTGKVDRATWRALGPLLTADAPVPSPELANSKPIQKLPPEPLQGAPVVTCKAWAFVDAATGEVLASHQGDERLHPASTTKLMTAYVVLRHVDKHPDLLDELVTFSARADQTPGSTSDINAGEKLPVRELLYGLMLPSGNDASVALAEYLGERIDKSSDAPSYDRFIAVMNDTAESLGMENTHYENPHGLTAKAHRASALDLARLARAAMQLPRLREVVGKSQHGVTLDSTAGYRRNVVWRNTNRLLGREGYLGIKTGTTGAAGACLVACAEREGREIIGVVLGSSSSDARYSDIRNLYRWVWNEEAHAAGDTVDE